LNSIVLSTIIKLETSPNQSNSERRDRDDIEMVLRENNNGGATRYFVNIGSRDNFDWMSLKDT
jgi:ATP-dependent RNA helicase DeaD